MKKFFLGFLIGAFLMAVIYFAPYVDPRFSVQLGRILDKDMIQLKDGSVIQGWILAEEAGEIYIEIEEGYFNLSLSQCKSIKKNYLMQYIKELM